MKNVLKRARKLQKQGFMRSALDLVERQLKQEPGEGRLWELKGLLLAKQRSFPDAIASLETASLLIPLGFHTQLAWAEAYTKVEQYSLALSYYEHVLQQPEFPYELFPRLAVGFARCGRLQRAVEVCRESVRRQPNNDSALFGLAQYMLQAGYSPRRIVPLLRKSIHLAPDCYLYQITLINLLDKTGDRGSAYDALTEIPADKLMQLQCKNCLERFLELCIEQEDYALSAVIARRLKSLGVSSRGCSECRVRSTSP